LTADALVLAVAVFLLALTFGHRALVVISTPTAVIALATLGIGRDTCAVLVVTSILTSLSWAVVTGSAVGWAVGRFGRGVKLETVS